MWGVSVCVCVYVCVKKKIFISVFNIGKFVWGGFFFVGRVLTCMYLLNVFQISQNPIQVKKWLISKPVYFIEILSTSSLSSSWVRGQKLFWLIPARQFVFVPLLLVEYLSSFLLSSLSRTDSTDPLDSLLQSVPIVHRPYIYTKECVC